MTVEEFNGLCNFPLLNYINIGESSIGARKFKELQEMLTALCPLETSK